MDRGSRKSPERVFPRQLVFIVPPHIQKEIIRNGTAAEREAMLHQLSVSEMLRGGRQAFAGPAAAVPAGRRRRAVYDAGGSEQLPGLLVREEGGRASRNRAVNEAYSASGRMYDFMAKVYGRSSIDGRGMRLDASVHFGVRYDNAFWNGSQMVYGDGDGMVFNRFTRAIDVVGHELTHGITQNEAGLQYRDQPGALNESFSDVFGSLLKQWVKKQTAAQADWIIGEGLFTRRIKAAGLRSMKAPGTAYDDPLIGRDPQPAHMKDYYRGADDNGGVHINSGIPNHAFYLAAVAIGGNAWEKAGRVWYVALCDRLRRGSSFADTARITVAVAGELFGRGGKAQAAVQSAWKQVGVAG